MSLVLENVSKIYRDGPKEFRAVDDVSLEVKQGEFVAIIGPSGSGKSTMLSIAGALLSPSEGKVFLHGEDITNLSTKKITEKRRDEIGFVFQAANLIPYLKVKDQLNLIDVLSKHKREKRSIELLEHFGLAHRINKYPNELSGGERQRVAIARALINDPQLILADEPTASLDSKRGREVVELLADEIKNRGKSGIMVTHDERVLDVCDRVISIRDGKIEKQ
ncbi:ABC transporter ATP-binding protein [Virgibacillus halodenitrificans]|jgi:putative ABC transport system ATP-binding protein|uniref:Putative hemin import ATP-binding protein HrtA n=1 Tax=Virgibacillus halodenitrificans TaxID=1482 RepID=A0AAC9NJJ4_VIRHA|nr:ABC transporter ATP-binding protein [Virgibacillus halodenitrificans]APC46900.1 hemin ABC transporter ATP-binding protein [Virgibacillus halodenitrificans]MCG1027510.1 ABC transporter ATP-binding protein [Virgibacillus halodenitrificans]MEC2159265.1 ABC transporter ATP-binding protein [Virgibacillus halodenitrificans]WHX25383.1 ABC transporter ATP-binding protein [Virgibacillus halodenitrificans]